MHKRWIAAAALAAACLVSPGPARAGHSQVTVNTVQVTRVNSDARDLSGTISISNTTPRAQTGTVTLVVFEVDLAGVVAERARRTVGTADLAANGSVTVSYRQRVSRPGTFLVLADYASSIGGNPVAHTHCSTLLVDAR